jgi:hypothetical protein
MKHVPEPRLTKLISVHNETLDYELLFLLQGVSVRYNRELTK